MKSRYPTQDEQDAAEAAFSCQPLNADWSLPAKNAYRRILDVMWAHCIDCEFEICEILPDQAGTAGSNSTRRLE